MNWLKEVFKSSETRAAEQAARDAALRQKFEKEAEAKRLAEIAAAEERAAEEERTRKEVEAKLLQEKMDSTTPWFEPIIGSEDTAFIHQRYRWNQAFIKDLIKKGHKGDTDSEVFQSYLARQDEEERQRVIAEEREKKRLSAEPWVEVVGEKIDEDGRIELQLDWNAAFVKYLRLNGFRGATDDVLVQAWLAALEKDTNGEEYH